MNKLIAILYVLYVALWFTGCRVKQGYSMYFELEAGASEANGWIEIDGERHDIQIVELIDEE